MMNSNGLVDIQILLSDPYKSISKGSVVTIEGVSFEFLKIERVIMLEDNNVLVTGKGKPLSTNTSSYIQ